MRAQSYKAWMKDYSFILWFEYNQTSKDLSFTKFCKSEYMAHVARLDVPESKKRDLVKSVDKN